MNFTFYYHCKIFTFISSSYIIFFLINQLKQRIKKLEKQLNEKRYISKEELYTSLTSSSIQECNIYNSDNEVITNDTSYRDIFIKTLKANTSNDAIMLLASREGLICKEKRRPKLKYYISKLRESCQGKDANGIMKDVLTLIEANNYLINITIKLGNNTLIYYENS